MPVFDFSSIPENEKKQDPVCTYTMFRSNEAAASPEKPILILDNSSEQWKHHAIGVFGNQNKRTNFEFREEGSSAYADILQIDARFVSLVRWLGENHINVRLSGENREEGYAVYKIRETAFGGGTKLSAEDGFLQFMMERLFASSAPAEEEQGEDEEEDGDDMKLTSLQSISDFMTCAGRTMPENIRLWARRNLAVARSHEVSPEERATTSKPLIRWKPDGSWTRNCTTWRESSSGSWRPLSRLTVPTPYRLTDCFWWVRPETVNPRSLMRWRGS